MKAQATFPLLDLLDSASVKRRRRAGNNAVGLQPDLLDLSSLHTISCDKSNGHYQIEAEPSSRPLNCPRCGVPGHLHRHDNRQQWIKDIPIRGKRVLIRLARPRYKCQSCGQVIQPSVDGINLHQGITIRLEQYIAQESLRTDKNFLMLADEVGVDEKTVRNIFTKHIKQISRLWSYEAPRCLGIDEVYVAEVARCILTDVKHHRLVNLLPKRDRLTVRRHLLQIKHPDRIKVVVMDMWNPYYKEVKQRFPHAIIVIDKFHVLRKATDAVMLVRKNLREQDKNLSLPKVPLLRKRRHKLSLKEKNKLKERLAQKSDLEQAHELKERLFNIWNMRDRQKAEQKYQEWAESIPGNLRYAFEDLLRAVKNWHEEIFNYFDERVTNAFTESLNKIIKEMQLKGRGYNFETLRARLVYGSPFVTREPISLANKERPLPQVQSPRKHKRKAKKAGSPLNPNSNVQQLKRIRESEDIFNELMRPPDGYIERFKHFEQLNLFRQTASQEKKEDEST